MQSGRLTISLSLSIFLGGSSTTTIGSGFSSTTGSTDSLTIYILFDKNNSNIKSNN